MPDREGCSLLVRNLDPSTTVEDIRTEFAKYGEVRDVYIPKDFYTGRPRGFGFVEFILARDATTALEAMNGQRILESTVEVAMAQHRRKSPGTMRKVTGGERDRDRDRNRDRHSDRDRYGRGRGRSRSRSRSGGRSYGRGRDERRGREYRRSDRSRSPRERRVNRSRSPLPPPVQREF